MRIRKLPPKQIDLVKSKRNNVFVINDGVKTNEQLLQQISQLGSIDCHPVHGPITEIKPSAQAVSIAKSVNKHDPHTDATYRNGDIPELIILHAREVDSCGSGTSYFISQDEILDGLSEEMAEVLLQSTFRFSRPSKKEQERLFAYAPLLNKRADSGLYLRWRYDLEVQPELVDSPNPQLAIEALAELYQRVKNATKHFYQANPGDTIIVHQHYALHARTEIRANALREMVRLWVNKLAS